MLESNLIMKINEALFKCNGQPKIIFGPLLKSEDEASHFLTRISDNAKTHASMSYTTSIETMELIFQFKTLRSSNLTNAKLNDKMEKDRVGISSYARGRFITCFSHSDHESIPFWAYYGGRKKENKVQLKFKNFANRFQDCIYTDYALLDDRTNKILFYSEEYEKTLSSNTIYAQLQGSSPINKDSCIKNCIQQIEMFDVKYIPTDSDNLKRDFSREMNVSGDEANNDPNLEMTVFEPEILGHEKALPWDYECETRIMCVLLPQDTSPCAHIDLRLKDEIFRDLTIIMNPWADNNFEIQIKSIINNSELPSDIKDSISIERSVVDGTVYLDIWES